MGGFNHIGSEVVRQGRQHQERSERHLARLWLAKEYVSGGYLAILPHTTTAMFLAILGASKFGPPRTCKRSVRRIMNDCGIRSKNTAFRAIKQLKELGLITTSSTVGEPNLYTINDHPSQWTRIR